MYDPKSEEVVESRKKISKVDYSSDAIIVRLPMLVNPASVPMEIPWTKTKKSL